PCCFSRWRWSGAICRTTRGTSTRSQWFSYAALSGLAGTHKPYQEWLAARLPWTRGEIEYLFIINAGIYLLLEVICERFSLSQMRAVGKAFRFVIPGHVLTSLFFFRAGGNRKMGRSTERSVDEEGSAC